jgi:hypothetical protein
VAAATYEFVLRIVGYMASLMGAESYVGAVAVVVVDENSGITCW